MAGERERLERAAGVLERLADGWRDDAQKFPSPVRPVIKERARSCDAGAAALRLVATMRCQITECNSGRLPCNRLHDHPVPGGSCEGSGLKPAALAMARLLEGT